MADYTFEGKTRQPVYPTSLLVNYVPKTANNDETVNWKNPATDNQFVPYAASLANCLNTSPIKAVISAPGEYVLLSPGVWRCRVEIHGKSGGAAVDPRVAVCDDATTANTFFEYDGDGDGLVGANKEADIGLTGFIRISVPTNVRLVLADGTATGAWGVWTARMFVRRICNYVAA